jgi:multiple sugar transport system ATP-binding protein
MAGISLEAVGKTYSDGTRAVSALDLEVPDGKLMVLVGPSGCGKTTTLLMVAGLEEVTEGTIRIGDKVVNDVAPMDRDIAMVFQNYALYPHMSVYRNMAFGLRMRKVDKNEIDRRVTDAARVLGLPPDLLPKKPKQLSGGQRQRVAMGRAIVRQPSAFLMDEPLSNLDAALRVEMRAEISRLQRDLGVTTIYVTHDQTEAMTLGDLVACFRDGLLQQVGAPQELYDRPRNLFVAGFMGSPAMNLSEAMLERSDQGLVARLADQWLGLAPEVLVSHPGLASRIGSKIIVGIRPEDIEDTAVSGSDPSDGAQISVVVELREAMGAETHLHFTIPGWSPPALTGALHAVEDEEGETDAIPRTGLGLTARVNAHTTAREGDEVILKFDTSALHFFDAGTGDRI